MIELRCICPGKQAPFYCPLHGRVEKSELAKHGANGPDSIQCEVPVDWRGKYVGGDRHHVMAVGPDDLDRR